jgi:chemotaxis protein methyltransferase CheR
LEKVDYEFVRDLVRQRSAIVLEEEKNYLVESRLQPLVRQEGFYTNDELVAKLRLDRFAVLQGKVVDAMTTNETSFFRDLHPFEALKKTILPELIASRSSARQIRIWCAACSTGQEPYSIAMLIQDHFPQLTGWQIRILATDLASNVLERAKAGRFNQTEINRGLPSPFIMKYFDRQGMNWQIKDSIRQMIDFQSLNLIGQWPSMAPIDIIFVRNVLIYFDVETKKTILGRMRRLLKPDGYLFLGGAESTINLDESFVRVEVDRASTYRLKNRV